MRKKEKTGSVSAYMNQFGKYFRKNWQLYIIFLLPGLLLTLIFKYLPMLGIIIAFEEYSPFLGYFDSKWIGAYNFKRLFSSTEFLRLLVNTLKLSGYNLLWSFFPADHSCSASEPGEKCKDQEKCTIGFLSSVFYFNHRTCRYDPPVLFSGGTDQCNLWNKY